MLAMVGQPGVSRQDQHQSHCTDGACAGGPVLTIFALSIEEWGDGFAIVARWCRANTRVTRRKAAAARTSQGIQATVR